MFNELKKKIDKIKELGWIPYEQNNYGNVGLQLERLLKINAENFEIPDYKNKIEIKTKISKNETKISLFNATPDSYLYEIKRIHKLYSYSDKNNPEYKILNQEITSNKKTKIKYNTYFSLKVNRNKKIIQLLVYNNNGVLIDNKTSWSFELLQAKLERKLKYLCYIEADKLYIRGQNYVKYKRDYYYILKGFDQFINLIDEGIISFRFKIGVFKTGSRKGQLHDHGTSITIDKNNLTMLFDKANY